LVSLGLTGVSIAWAVGEIVLSRLLDRFTATTMASSGLILTIAGGAMRMVMINGSTTICVVLSYR